MEARERSATATQGEGERPKSRQATPQTARRTTRATLAPGGAAAKPHGNARRAESMMMVRRGQKSSEDDASGEGTESKPPRGAVQTTKAFQQAKISQGNRRTVRSRGAKG